MPSSSPLHTSVRAPISAPVPHPAAYRQAHDLAKDYFHSVGTEQNWAWPTERRSLWTENIIIGGDNSLAPMFEYLFRQEQLMEERRLGYQCFLVGPAMDIVGPRWGPNSTDYIRKVKSTYDPQSLADSFYFIPPYPMPGSKTWPLLKRFVFRPTFRPLLQKMVAMQVPTKKT